MISMMEVSMELPPRARRIHILRCILNRDLGTTSACAENTRVPHRNYPTIRNYLRVRGEYFFVKFCSICASELPPRARRIRLSAIAISSGLGTTSACAENTGNQFPAVKYQWNYLRVRGEYISNLIR